MDLPKAAGRLGLAKRGGSARRGTPKKVPPNIETRLFRWSFEIRPATTHDDNDDGLPDLIPFRHNGA